MPRVFKNCAECPNFQSMVCARSDEVEQLRETGVSIAQYAMHYREDDVDAILSPLQQVDYFLRARESAEEHFTLADDIETEAEPRAMYIATEFCEGPTQLTFRGRVLKSFCYSSLVTGLFYKLGFREN